MNKQHPALADAAKPIPDFEARMDPADRNLYQAFQGLRVDGAFDGKIYYVFSVDNKNRPTVHTRIRVNDFECNSKDGSTVEVEDLTTGETVITDHIPRIVFDLPVFMYTATVSYLRFTQKTRSAPRTLAYPIMIKTQHSTNLGYLKPKAIYVENKKGMEILFPDFQLAR